MTIDQKHLGRRQFLVAAGAASTSVLALKKFSGDAFPVFEPSVANASESPGSVASGGASKGRYRHLLSPLRIGNVVLKNRMMAKTTL